MAGPEMARSGKLSWVVDVLLVAGVLLSAGTVALFVYGRKTVHGWDVLRAAQEGRASKLSWMLIARPDLVNAWNYAGEMPLHIAADRNKVEVTRLLLRRGGDVHARDQRGETPLHHAARDGSLEVAALLLAKGANPTALNYRGQTPIDLAALNGHKDVEKVLREHGAK